MKKIITIFLCSLIIISIIFMGYTEKIKKENAQLKENATKLQTEIDSLKATISELQQTDDYYYQMGVNSRHSGKYEESNNYLKQMIEKFPKSKLISDAEALIRKNNTDIAQSLYDEAVAAHKSEQYEQSNELVNKLLTKFPNSSLAYKAKELKVANQKGMKVKAEAALKEGYDLEIISWYWYITESASYVEAKGQVKNISGMSLEDVEVVVTYYDKDGNFITSDSALIDFNPILDGQVSPFIVYTIYNPAMKTASIEFKFLLGGTIPTYSRKK